MNATVEAGLRERLGKAELCLNLPKTCRDGGSSVSHTTCCQFSLQVKKERKYLRGHVGHMDSLYLTGNRKN